MRLRLFFTFLCFLMRPTPSFSQRLLTVLGALWLLALVAGPAISSALGLVFTPHGHGHMYAHGHPFVDARSLWGMPNAMDVLSNLPITLFGLWGWRMLASGRDLSATTQRAAQVFFAGLMFTGLGSAVYHWVPHACTLVWDRSGMAIAFAGMLSLALAERDTQAPAQCALGWILAAALLSAWLPAANGNALPWAVVQFGGLLLIAQLAFQPLAPDAIGVHLKWVIGLYLLAKVMELCDAQVFHATAGHVSGHTLKHLVSALAAWPVIAAIDPQVDRLCCTTPLKNGRF